MKDIEIDYNVVKDFTNKNGNYILKFTKDAKQCKTCFGIKNKKCFYKDGGTNDGLKVNCKTCMNIKTQEKALKKVRTETLKIINKINPGIASDTVAKIKKVTELSNSISVLRKVKLEIEKIYFKQEINDKLLDNIIGD